MTLAEPTPERGIEHNFSQTTPLKNISVIQNDTIAKRLTQM